MRGGGFSFCILFLHCHSCDFLPFDLEGNLLNLLFEVTRSMCKMKGAPFTVHCALTFQALYLIFNEPL